MSTNKTKTALEQEVFRLAYLRLAQTVVPCRCLFDGGAECSILSQELWGEHFQDVGQLRPSSTKLIGFNGSESITRGVATVEINLGPWDVPERDSLTKEWNFLVITWDPDLELLQNPW